MDFSLFKKTFGEPKRGTAADLRDLGLSHSAPLAEFVEQVGGGMFSGGLLSVVSVRERVSLGGWETKVPPRTRPFFTSAFGLLALSSGEDVWLADTQMNDVFEADMTIDA